MHFTPNIFIFKGVIKWDDLSHCWQVLGIVNPWVSFNVSDKLSSVLICQSWWHQFDSNPFQGAILVWRCRLTSKGNPIVEIWWSYDIHICPVGLASLLQDGIFIWVRSRRWGCLVTWFCYQLIAKPDNKTVSPLWPDPYWNITLKESLRISIECCVPVIP